MEYIRINNLIIGKYMLNFSLENNLCYGVISSNIYVKQQLLLALAGINDNKQTCFYQNKSIYDNEEYFANRVYLDFKKKYFRTLNVGYITKSMMDRFGVKFNASAFKESVSQTNLRNEVLVTDEYKFTEYGINSCGYCLLKGLNYKNLIILNPIYKVRTEINRKTFIEYITNKNIFNNIIIDVNNPLLFNKLVDKYIVLGDFNIAYLIDPVNDTFIITDDNMMIKDKIFKKDNIVVALNNYERKDLRNLKQKYKIVTFYEITKYVDIEALGGKL